MYRCRDSLVREGGGLENHWWQHLGSSNLPFGVNILFVLILTVSIIFMLSLI